MAKAAPGVSGPHTIISGAPLKGLMERAGDPLVLFALRTKNKRLQTEKESCSRVLIAYQTVVWRDVCHHRQESDAAAERGPAHKFGTCPQLILLPVLPAGPAAKA